ncbi:MAG TPA: GyrI-like domain-containing protein [Chloroflexia bacterium]|nr:GyrI-like domain-containing protein [Chloroflexia bacterium]
MSYVISLCEVQSSYLAVVRATVTPQNLGATIRQILVSNKVYSFIKQAGLEKAGHNVIVYKNDRPKFAGNLPKEFEIEVGVQVAGPFEGDGQVVSSLTPRGKAATTLHTGPYDQLGQAHTAIMDWARAHHYPLTGRSWEVYGDWHEDPNQLTTQVFYLYQDSISTDRK